jgi:hypothetical protein
MLKASDPMPRLLAEVFAAWVAAPGTAGVRAAELDETVRVLINPHGQGRQSVVAFLNRHVGTCAAGYTMSAQRPAGRWGPLPSPFNRMHRLPRNLCTPWPLCPIPPQVTINPFIDADADIDQFIGGIGGLSFQYDSPEPSRRLWCRNDST